MKSKKSLIAIMSLVIVAIVGVTFAYFQTSATFTNLFNTGTYHVVTTEVFESPDNWAPGQEIPKSITSTNEGTIPAAVRVSYTEQWLKEIDGVETDVTSQVASGTAIINLDNTNSWIHEGNYYYYKYILEPGDTTKSFIKSVTLNPNINGATCVTSQDGLTQVCEATNPALGATYKLTITKETVQANKYQELWNANVEIKEKPLQQITYLSRQVEGQITPGDVIGIGETEDFYVISSDSEKTVLLSKYNLMVGNIKQDGVNIGTIPQSTPGYGLQSIDATAGYSVDNSYGSIEFSNDVYWSDNKDLKYKYTEDNAIYHDNTISLNERGYRYTADDSYAAPYIYDENSTIYQYISGENGYVNRLIEIGAPSSITGRLLSYEEAIASENLTDSNNNSIIYDGTNDYWLGSGFSYKSIYAITNEYNFPFGFDIDTYKKNFGVRPVIEIPTSALQ